MHKTFLLFWILCLSSQCKSQEPTQELIAPESGIVVGAERVNDWLPFTRDKKIGLVVNQTSLIKEKHLVDSLLALDVSVQAIFAPEHGFRGDHGAGEKVNSGKDAITQLPIISLYGSHKKPTKKDLAEIGLVIFDIQDVGARFYTYISTMHYVMEACAEQDIPVLILDRPNPNGHYVDGPVLDSAYSSFVGMHPVPVVHGMTIGEYARMINEEGWLRNGVKCNLEIITVKNYTHQTRYSLPVRPSPNLPNDNAIAWYPSLCFFEGTSFSLGRGTATPFQVIGHPSLKATASCDTSFIPKPIPGISPHPPLENKLCYGKSYTSGPITDTCLHLEPLLWAYSNYSGDDFFNSFFKKLAGNELLQKQIIAGKSIQEIRQSWQKDLADFKVIRAKYLLYP